MIFDLERLRFRVWIPFSIQTEIGVPSRHSSDSGRKLKSTDIEVVALSKIAKQHPALVPQVASATVLERENTGVGFFTRLAVDRSAAAAIDSDRILGDVWLDIQGFLYPMTFMVFMEDGFVSLLEGATVGDETDHIDLCSLRSEGPTTMGRIVVDASPER